MAAGSPAAGYLESPMVNAEKHETVLDVGSIQARLAKVYAEALLAAAARQDAVESAGDDLDAFVRDVLDANPGVAEFLGSPAVGRKAKESALDAALTGQAPDLIRGLFAVLTEHGMATMQRVAPHHVASVRRHFIDLLSEEAMEELHKSLVPIAEHLRSHRGKP